MKRLDVRILIFLYGAILIMLGTLGSAEKIILVVATACLSSAFSLRRASFTKSPFLGCRL